MVTVSAFPVTGKWWCFHVMFFLAVVCFTSEIAKVCAGATDQKPFPCSD